MLRQDRPLFAALIAVAFAIFLCWIVPNLNYQPNQNGEKCAAHECREDAATEAIAEYTKWLVFVTAVLAIFSVAQGIFLYRADKTARVAANAAKLSAEAAIGVELPKLVLQYIGFATSVGNFSAKLQSPSLIVRVKNYGRTPAFIRQECVDFAFHLPPKPNYRNGVSVPDETVVEPGEIHAIRAARVTSLTPPELIRDVLEDRAIFWVYGYVTYRDFLGKWHETRFIKQLLVVGDEGSHMFIDGPDGPYSESF